MINAESGGSGLQNETSNERGGSNEGRIKNRNGRRIDRIGNWYRTEKVKGKVEELLTLRVMEEKRTGSCMVFQK